MDLALKFYPVRSKFSAIVRGKNNYVEKTGLDSNAGPFRIHSRVHLHLT